MLTPDQQKLCTALSLSCRHDIIAMLRTSQSGHPGGSLSLIDFLVTLYATRIVETQEPVIVSNGHTSPAVYSILAACGYIPQDDVINTFRKIGSIYEGHITRHVAGVHFGTGPLGCGLSAATGFALAEQKKQSGKFVFCCTGDGELQEGQVREACNFAAKHALSNLVVFVDYNKVQLSGSLDAIMPTNIRGLFAAAGRNILECDGHNHEEIATMLTTATKKEANPPQPSLIRAGVPTVILGHTIMGKGVSFMEATGRELKSDRHGKAPSIEQCDQALQELVVGDEQKTILAAFKTAAKKAQINIATPTTQTGTPRTYTAATDNRSAYGNALTDLAECNPHILAMTADVADSVKTNGVLKAKPAQHIECGIGEQNMISAAGGLSVSGFVPFCSTFAAFISSRAKDQARLNDINQTNVKMVATHAGLSVGEDGPTHQCIDDITSFLGMFHTKVIEPADPNQTDRIIRSIAKEHGNFYVRMGRHKLGIITKEDGAPYFGNGYEFVYGKSDLICEGNDVTVVAIGSCVREAFQAVTNLKKNNPDKSIALISRSCPKIVDDVLLSSIKKTKKVITIEDHTIDAGIGSILASHLTKNGIAVSSFTCLGVSDYQFSGKSEDLYAKVGIDAKGIEKTILEICK